MKPQRVPWALAPREWAKLGNMLYALQSVTSSTQQDYLKGLAVFGADDCAATRSGRIRGGKRFAARRPRHHVERQRRLARPRVAVQQHQVPPG